MQDSRLYTQLALAGTLPFIACALLPLAGIEAIPPFGRLDTVAGSYGLAIVCFLAGTHWGIYLSGESSTSFNLFITSNAVFLLAWFAYIAASLASAIVVQVIALSLLLVIDYRLRQGDIVSARYFGIRSLATLIAILSLLVVLMFR